MKIRSYREADSMQAYALWEKTIGGLWPIEAAFFHAVLDAGGSKTHVVAEIDGQIAGFLGIDVGDTNQPHPSASIQLIMVHPAHQRKGIASALLAHGEQKLRSLGVTDIHAGAGAAAYYWPGVPENLPAAVHLFEKHGWSFHERSFDLVADLTRSPVPSDAHWNDDIRISTASADDIEDVLAFERDYFPEWYSYFEQTAARSAFNDILVARDRDSVTCAAVLLFGPAGDSAEHSLKWRTLLGPRMGGFGAIGVRPDRRGRGIGLTLARRATAMLKARGVQHSYLGWTWLTDWYGRLGYEVWRSYRMGTKRIGAAPDSAARTD